MAAQVKRELLHLARERRDPAALTLGKLAPLVVERPCAAQLGMHAKRFAFAAGAPARSADVAACHDPCGAGEQGKPRAEPPAAALAGDEASEEPVDCPRNEAPPASAAHQQPTRGAPARPLVRRPCGPV